MADRLLAEYADQHAVAAAIRRLRADGYTDVDAYIPYPSHEVEDALSRRPSRLPFVIFACGMLGAGGAYALQWLLVAFLYPLNVGGRPPHFPLAFVIITFEMGVLFASFGAFFGTLGLGRLVRLTDEVQATPGFESATQDRFWVEVLLADPAARDPERTRALLIVTGARRVEVA